MTRIFSTPEVSLEAAVAFQVSNIFRMELTNAIEESRGTGKLDIVRIAAVIKKHTNLSVQVGLDTTLVPNAYVIPPKVDKNHPIVNEWRRAFNANTDGINSINFTNGAAFGGVDFETGKVSGVFSKLTSEIWITKGAIEGYGQIRLTSGEITGMIIHEIGHVITYFATLGQTFRTAFILDGFVRETMKVNEKEVRYKLIREFESETGVTISDKVRVAESENEGSIATVVLSDIIESSRSQYGTTLYDMRSWEALSDQYAARMGCAGELASALDKLYGIYEPMYYRGTFKYLMVEIGKFLGVFLLITANALLLNILGLVIIFVYLSASPHQREYDNPHERLVKLRNELIAQLKDKNINKERSASLLADIEAINRALDNVKDRHSFFEKFWLVVSPYTRRQVKMGKEIQELEQLVNNEIFVEAAKLKKLA
ncbi:hypothetical protein [Serratia phage PCH45]|uniref:hypothetical protein n=1 Tax=Serratia phage PCH45 TaxID=2608368 RepID=UPI0012A91344|nr:hypothetical protein [Serratia phage PCH45]